MTVIMACSFSYIVENKEYCEMFGGQFEYSTQDELKKAYMKLSKNCYVYKSGGDSEKVKN